MNDETTDLDQTDEDILTYTVSDEALEAAGMERELWTDTQFFGPGCCHWPGLTPSGRF